MIRRFLAATLLVACAPITAPPTPSAPLPPTQLPSAGRDFDGDGLVDPRDRCPRDHGEPPFGCPVADDDGNGLTTLDRCPLQPGPVPHGCPPPDPDPDGDGVTADSCPADLETRNGFRDHDGCPDEIPADLAAFTGPIKGVGFELDRIDLLPTAKPVLDRAARVLQRYPDVRIEVSAHLDSTGSPEYGHGISLWRAQEVVRYLVARGVDKERLMARKAGPDEPIASNKTAAGRARNRRVEFEILVE